MYHCLLVAAILLALTIASVTVYRLPLYKPVDRFDWGRAFKKYYDEAVPKRPMASVLEQPQLKEAKALRFSRNAYAANTDSYHCISLI
ncbi:MAG: hypothetical protein LBF60_05735 [Treponema sp.]|nr:hypothetical protein [Treponema sp.]